MNKKASEPIDIPDSGNKKTKNIDRADLDYLKEMWLTAWATDPYDLVKLTGIQQLLREQGADPDVSELLNPEYIAKLHTMALDKIRANKNPF